MERSADKEWARSYVLDPLLEPQPSEETGPGTHFRPDATTSGPLGSSSSSKKLSKRPFSQSRTLESNNTLSPDAPGQSKRNPYPSPPRSASPRQARISPSHKHEALTGVESSIKNGRNRSSSLGERYPGDISQRPLEQIKKDAKLAYRAPHLRKSHMIRPDIVDSLSTVGDGPYHHEGPFDAALLARNISKESSPLNALEHSNQEALKATPREKIADSVLGHRPLDGVASYAPGEVDRNGHLYDYEQGDNMMISGGEPEGGAYKRWPGVRYHPDDVKGKGEPSYSIEKSLKEQGVALKGHRKALSSGDIEMTPQRRHAEHNLIPTATATDRDAMWWDGEGPRVRRGTGSLKKTLGSVKKHLHREPS